MPCLSSRFDPAVGPLIQVGITQPGAIVPAAAAANASLSVYTGLIDTGASVTCISPHVASALSLRPLGKRPVVSATHAVAMNLYLVDLLLLFGASAIHRPGVEALEFAQDSGASFQMLIGRDVLCRGVFTMSFDGHFTFSV